MSVSHGRPTSRATSGGTWAVTAVIGLVPALAIAASVAWLARPDGHGLTLISGVRYTIPSDAAIAVGSPPSNSEK